MRFHDHLTLRGQMPWSWQGRRRGRALPPINLKSFVSLDCKDFFWHSHGPPPRPEYFLIPSSTPGLMYACKFRMPCHLARCANPGSHGGSLSRYCGVIDGSVCAHTQLLSCFAYTEMVTLD